MSDPHEYGHNDHGDASDAESEHDLARRMTAQQNRPASIDMALSLERELDEEHDEYDQEGLGKTASSDGVGIGDAPDAANRRVSLDPHVLQHIVATLREELARTNQERDALADSLATAPTREAELREALSLLTERCAALEAEIEQLRRKSQDDDDAIHMLRTKVEESRRALMRLQTESKRMSQMSHMSIDTSRANSFFGGAPSSSKRASFTPLTGSGAVRMQNHRRISSVSEPSFALETGSERLSPTGVGPTASWPEESDTASVISVADAKKARRSSAFFGAAPASMAFARSTSPSPPKHPRQLTPEPSINAELTAQQLEALRKERDAARAELAAARQELAEAQDAREASEQCVSALRSFISAQAEGGESFDGGIGAAGILKLPPLPTEKNTDIDLTDGKKGRQPSGAGWSFGKLFRADSSGNGPSASGSNGTSPTKEGVPSLVASVLPTPSISTASAPNGTNNSSPSTATPGGAFSRTFGGFFAARAPSITSMTSITGNPPAVPPKEAHPPAAHGQQEPTMNGMGSDEEDDSIDEPAEPASPVVEPGRANAEVMVRNASSVTSEEGPAYADSLKGPEPLGEHDEAPIQIGAL